MAESLGTDLTPEAIANADYGLRNAAFGALRNKIGGDASLWQEFQALESKAEKHAWLADYILDPTMAKRTFAVNKTTRTTRNLQDEKDIWLTEAFNGLAIVARGGNADVVLTAVVGTSLATAVDPTAYATRAER